MMSLWFWIFGAITIAYLLIQAKEDKKTKTVYVGLNNGMLVFATVVYFAKCFFYQTDVHWIGLVGCIVFLLLHSLLFRFVMGTGDAKALAIFYLQSGLLYNDSSYFDLFFPIFIYFVANIIFTISTIAKGIKEKKKAKDIFFGKERQAFFPYLLYAYVASLFIWWLSF